MSHKDCFQAQGDPFSLASYQLPAPPLLHGSFSCHGHKPARAAPDSGDCASEAGSRDVDVHELAAFQAFEWGLLSRGASRVPSGLDLLSTSILCWALSGVHQLAEDGLSFSCHVGSQSSSLEIWKVALCSGSPGLVLILPTNFLQPQGSTARR